MNTRVIKVKPTGDFKLKLTFSNGEEKVLDMKPFLNTGRFTELKNEAMFASVVCTMGSIQWQNGLDLCPDSLYEESIPYNKIKNKEKG
jgi:hypothetical protein